MKSIDRTIKITDYFISLPRPLTLLASLLLVSILFSIPYSFLTKTKYLASLLTSFYLLFLPSIFAGLLAKLLLRDTPFKRILILSLFGEVITAVSYLLFIFLSSFGYDASVLVFLAGGFVFLLWYISARFFFAVRWRALLLASIQLLFYIIFLFATKSIFLGDQKEVLVKFGISSVALLLSLYFMFFILNAPAKKSFGFTTFEAIPLFFAQWFYEKDYLEEKLINISSKMFVTPQLVSFIGKTKAHIVNPMIHFGPFGNLGSSSFPSLISHFNSSFVAVHSTVSHDLNMIFSEDAKRYAKKLIDLFNNKPKTTSSFVAYNEAQYGNAKAHVLHFNDFALVMLSRAPFTTEDITLGAGLVLKKEAEKYVKFPLIIDEHNAETGEVTMFDAGEEETIEYEEALKLALQSKLKKKPLHFGFSRFYPDNEKIASAGISVFYFSSDPEVFLIIIDSNGIKHSFAEKIRKKIKPLGKAIILTTDTHEVNMVKGVLNPLEDDSKLLKEIYNACLSAKNSASKSKAEYRESKEIVNVLGPKNALEIIATVNAITSVAKIITPLALVISFLIVIFLITWLY